MSRTRNSFKGNFSRDSTRAEDREDERRFTFNVYYEAEGLKIHYNLFHPNGDILLRAEDVGRCPARTTNLGKKIYEEIFGYEPDGRPSFGSIDFRYRKRKILGISLGYGISIELNTQGIHSLFEGGNHKFTPKEFIKFLGRLDKKGFDCTTESIQDILQYVEPAVRQELSQYRQKLNERYNACHVRENAR
ncbi:MAG: hypothetical protein KKA65_05625 [Nanoarchaeota archaeon]|nr:hypothetical protein [Nanoarchaeota archaeon]MBU4456950.1 hypothetical protein [Nanoarchaeota archaeon]MCG2719163.1 hypothetical protein [Nanoarchaeota archaeon]